MYPMTAYTIVGVILIGAGRGPLFIAAFLAITSALSGLCAPALEAPRAFLVYFYTYYKRSCTILLSGTALGCA